MNLLKILLIFVSTVTAVCGFLISDFHYRTLPCSCFDSKWEVENPPDSEEIKKILSQNFTYLGRGYQSYVLVSKDHQYVLKLAPRFHYCLHPLVQQFHLPPFLESIRNKKIARKQAKRDKYFSANKIGYEKLKNECGLIYVHLNPTDHLKMAVTIYDDFRRSRIIDIDHEVFIIQKKMKPICGLLKEYSQKKEQEKVHAAIRYLVRHISNTMRKGIINSDRSYYNNYGFIDNEIACFDVGSFREDPNLKDSVYFSAQQQYLLAKTRLWIQKHYPEELSLFDQESSKQR